MCVLCTIITHNPWLEHPHTHAICTPISHNPFAHMYMSCTQPFATTHRSNNLVCTDVSFPERSSSYKNTSAHTHMSFTAHLCITLLLGLQPGPFNFSCLLTSQIISAPALMLSRMLLGVTGDSERKHKHVGTHMHAHECTSKELHMQRNIPYTWNIVHTTSEHTHTHKCAPRAFCTQRDTDRHVASHKG